MNKHKTLYAAASAGVVYIMGDGVRIAVTPEVAVTLAADLPRIAAQARLLAGEDFDLTYMAETLANLGYAWHGTTGAGRWVQSDAEPVTETDDYERATRRVFAEVVCGAVGPVQ